MSDTSKPDESLGHLMKLRGYSVPIEAELIDWPDMITVRAASISAYMGLGGGAGGGRPP